VADDVRISLDGSQVQTIRAAADAAAKLEQELRDSEAREASRQASSPTVQDLRQTVDSIQKATAAAERALRLGERVAATLARQGLAEEGRAAQFGAAADVFGSAGKGAAAGITGGAIFGPGGAFVGGVGGLVGGATVGLAVGDARRDAAELVQRERNRAFREEQESRRRLEERLR
jgi:hypothetical protein